MEHKTFLQACIDGDACLDDADDWIDQWHDGDTGVELIDYMGFTWEQWNWYLLDPDVCLKTVVRWKTEKTPLPERIGDLTNYMLAKASPSGGPYGPIVTMMVMQYQELALDIHALKLRMDQLEQLEKSKSHHAM